MDRKGLVVLAQLIEITGWFWSLHHDWVIIAVMPVLGCAG